MDASRETCLAVIMGKAMKVLYTDRLFLCVSRRCHSTTSWEIYNCFKRKNWVDTDINKYSDLCRQCYLRDYQEAPSMPLSPMLGKRSHAAMKDEDEAYEAFLNSLSTNSHLNEYDHYISSPISEQRIPILQ